MNLKIGNVKIKSKVILSPMAGVSNPAYFKICEKMGLGYAVTELISTEAVIRNNKKTLEMLNGIKDLKVPIAIQIFGSNKNTMAKAAKILEEKFHPDIIDINMGCPVPKVAVKNESGSALLKNPQKVYEIVKAVKEKVSVPVTVKIRSGWDEKSINAKEIAKEIEKAGASAIAIHARTRSQGYSGKANWNIIKEVKETVTIPVIGNGDIKTKEDAKRMLEETGCDAVMIGRSALGNPWLIKECNNYIEKNKEIKKTSNKQKIDMIKKHYIYLKKYKGEKKALLEIRTHALWYIKGLPNSKEFKERITSSKTEKEFLKLLKELKKGINTNC